MCGCVRIAPRAAPRSDPSVAGLDLPLGQVISAVLAPSGVIALPTASREMASAASRVNQKFRESVGLASTTVDNDVVKVLGTLKELEADVALLRKVMETANRLLNRTLPDARTQAVQTITAMGAKLIIRPEETEVYTSLREVHESLDGTLPKKFGEVRARDNGVMSDVPLVQQLSSRTDLREGRHCTARRVGPRVRRGSGGSQGHEREAPRLRPLPREG